MGRRGLFSSGSERDQARAIVELIGANPFLEERIAIERRVLGDDFIPSEPYWSLELEPERRENIDLIAERSATLLDGLRDQLRGGCPASSDDLRLYEELVVYVLYDRYRAALLEWVERDDAAARVSAFRYFRRDLDSYCDLPGVDPALRASAAHLFACFYQVRRAFTHTFGAIAGRSRPAARLRAAVWQSIFTHDMRRYRRALYEKMSDVATLIGGPTGTGKELVARAIALSRYIPFDEKNERFKAIPSRAFISLNLSALSPTLIESELFGHRKGAFTGAVDDREGFFESSGRYGTVFLDEVGDLDASIQVKLLRVLQGRTFQRLGDPAPRRFEGKVIAATNRDLPAAIAKGSFRQDFYYRLCADTIVTPSLAEQLAERSDELAHLVRFISGRIAGESEAEALTEEVCAAIEDSPGRGYSWPGNFRELEQCVRSVMLRGAYAPPAPATDLHSRLADAVVSGTMTADALVRSYCTLLYAREGNYSRVAEITGLDRRTVKAKVDAELPG